MAIDFERTRQDLTQFSFQKLFVEELGWSQPSSRKSIDFLVGNAKFARRPVAGLAGVAVFEVEAKDGKIPDAKTRAAVHKEIAKLHHENLLIFVDAEKTQSVWYWVKRQEGKIFPRDHSYFRGQPGDLFLSKLGQIVFDLSEFDAEGNVSIVEVARRLRAALDVERVTRKFYGDFQQQHDKLLDLIDGVPDERSRRWYASVLLNRLMFIYFLQKKGFVDHGDLNYLRNKLVQSQEHGTNEFFSGFLQLLFFEGFAKPEEKRSPRAVALLGKIKYLNGGLFLRHALELTNPKLNVPDRFFSGLFDLFDRYSWNLDDTPGGKDDEINPDVLGYIFEKYINQKTFGAYYTRPEITEYLCERTIHQLILDAVNTPEAVQKHALAGVKSRAYESVGDLLLDLDAPLCKRLLHDVLPRLSLLDPACGSGAFLVAAMKMLINVYAAVIGKIKFLGDRNLTRWLVDVEREHASVSYFIKKAVITDNLYGVDLMEEATEIAKLRLFLALVASAQHVDQLEPLPNIDFNILAGNSLIGLMRVDDKDFEKRQAQGDLYRKNYRQVLEQKNRLIDIYRHAAGYAEDLSALRGEIADKKREAYETLDAILLQEFQALGVKYEQAAWDVEKGREGKPVKRALRPTDIEALHPFHWGYEFDEILHKRGGFDAIITNPPWEVFKPNAKEFFQEHSDLVTKKKMTIKEFEKEQASLLEDPQVRRAWLEYLSGFPHVSAFFRSAPQYKNQVSVVNGKRVGTDINLYKLFVEQCHNLLRTGGRCGIITAGSLYTDLGAKNLREILFSQSKVDTLFGLSNEKYIFEGVHHSQKICILVFAKDGSTEEFTAGFRINPREAVRPNDLERFLHDDDNHVRVSVDLLRLLSPDSLSLLEVKNDLDLRITEKMSRFPLLGERMEGVWNLRLTNDFHMTGDSHLFKPAPGKGRLPLVEGKMIHQFTCDLSQTRYWVSEKDGRRALLGRDSERGQRLGYESYRLAHRSIARNTDSRTMIATVLPRDVFFGHSLNGSTPELKGPSLLFATAVLNSLSFDYALRLRVAANITMFYIYQLPVPRSVPGDPTFQRIVDRTARLICTGQEFDELAKEIGLEKHRARVTDEVGRAKLRAEIDGLVAHLYGLTEEEFGYILTTFPLVADPVKVATQNAYRDVARGVVK